MNLWFVGNAPIGHYAYISPAEERGEICRKVFFMKARIMAGQAVLQKNHTSEKFLWLTREEIGLIAGRQYYNAIRGMLPAR